MSSRWKKKGATFTNYFVTDSLCCPSRSSIFTGEFPHNTGVFRNVEPDGGYGGFNAHGNEPNTFAVALQRNGYRTAMLGKYLNGYHPGIDGPATGWNEWSVAGDGYHEFKYSLNRKWQGHLPRHETQRLYDRRPLADRGQIHQEIARHSVLHGDSPPLRRMRLMFPLRATRTRSLDYLRRALRRLTRLRTRTPPDG